MMPLVSKCLRDVVDGEVLLAKDDDLISYLVGFRCGLRAFVGWQEKLPVWIFSELVAKDTKTTWRIAKAFGDFSRREFLDEEGSERFVLAMCGIGRL